MGEKKINDGVETSKKEISGLFPDCLSLMLDKPHMRQNKLKTSLRLSCLRLNQS